MRAFRSSTFFIYSFFFLILQACSYESRFSALEERVAALEQWCSVLNSNINSLYSIVSAYQFGDYITSVAPVTSNGEILGYTFTFGSGEPITVFNGQDGISPFIGVKQDLSGDWFWTVNGEWLLDSDGQKVIAVGKKGEDGHTPIIGVKQDTDGNWYWILDGEWLLGNEGQKIRAEGTNGRDGDSFFKLIEVTDTDVTFMMVDGQSFTIPRASALSIRFDSSDLLAMAANSKRSIHYVIISNCDEIEVEVLSSSDIIADVSRADAKSGYINVETSDFIDNHSKVVVLVSDGVRTIMRKFIFELEAIKIEDNAFINVSDTGGLIALEFFSNIPCQVIVPESASSWISFAPDTKSLGKYSIVLQVNQNRGQGRAAVINVKGKDEASRISVSYTILQNGYIGQKKHFLIENEVVHKYLEEVNYESFTSSLIQNYAVDVGYRMDWPDLYEFNDNSSSSGSFDLSIFKCWQNNLLFNGHVSNELAGTIVSSFSPTSAIMYELDKEEDATGPVVKDTVLLTGQLRMIKTDNGHNIRDIGGWKTNNGCVVQYGKVYRGAAFYTLSTNDLIILRDILKIGVEIDLRSNKELLLEDDNPANDRNYSLIGNDVSYYHCPLPLDHDYLPSHEIYAKIFHIIVKSLSEDKPVYIHCAGGADRTGAVCMLLESVLGVIDSDIAKDFELTSFAPNYYDKNNLRYCTRCKTVLNYFAEQGETGLTRQERIESFLINQGVTEQEISDFRRQLLMRDTQANY